MSLPLYQVDAFTDKPFGGNPAGVCLLDDPAQESWMQAVGSEMNLSETAFLYPEADGFRLRWFTPTVEVALCGHATLASAHVLWEIGRLEPGGVARFHTQSGLLSARRDGGWIQMDFPAVSCQPVEPPVGLLEALGVHGRAVFRAGTDYIVELASEHEVRAAAPDLARLACVEARGVAVTAPATLPGYDIASRFFAPAAGIPEDPVTGSLHCALAPLWCARLGRPGLTAYQASARGGSLRLRVAGDRVLISGQAVTIFRAELTTD